MMFGWYRDGICEKYDRYLPDDYRLRLIEARENEASMLTGRQGMILIQGCFNGQLTNEIYSLLIVFLNLYSVKCFINGCVLFAMLDGPAVVRVNIFVRSISKIDDVTMVSVNAPETKFFIQILGVRYYYR